MLFFFNFNRSGIPLAPLAKNKKLRLIMKFCKKINKADYGFFLRFYAKIWENNQFSSNSASLKLKNQLLSSYL